MGMAAILYNGAEPFGQIVNIPSTEGPMWNLKKMSRAVLILYNVPVYSPRAREDNPGAKFWS